MIRRALHVPQIGNALGSAFGNEQGTYDGGHEMIYPVDQSGRLRKRTMEYYVTSADALPKIPRGAAH
jgi:hypothetical protein